MKSNKIYILKKDLPRVSAGNLFTKEEGRYYLLPSQEGNPLMNRLNFAEMEVENTPDWFELKKESCEEFTKKDIMEGLEILFGRIRELVNYKL